MEDKEIKQVAILVGDTAKKKKKKETNSKPPEYPVSLGSHDGIVAQGFWLAFFIPPSFFIAFYT